MRISLSFWHTLGSRLPKYVYMYPYVCMYYSYAYKRYVWL